MSSLLEQAFVDAKALKEAALKNAEATIVDKYSTEVKETLNKILEQDELGLGAPAAGMDPMGAAPAPAAGGDAAEDIMVVQDPLTGMVFEVAVYKGFNKAMIQVGAVWGVKAWNSDAIAVLMG